MVLKQSARSTVYAQAALAHTQFIYYILYTQSHLKYVQHNTVQSSSNMLYPHHHSHFIIYVISAQSGYILHASTRLYISI